MEEKQKGTPSPNGNMIWEYVVNDFLETGCYLTFEERDFLLRHLRQSEPRTESIDVHPCFSLDGNLIIVASNGGFRGYVLYNPKHRLLKRFSLR